MNKPVETRQPPGLHTYIEERTGRALIKTHMEKFNEFSFLANSTSKSVEELWIYFNSSVNEGLSRFVPCKKIG